MKKWLKRGLVTLLLIAVGGGVFVYRYLGSADFREWMRQTIVAEVDRVSGGRAELESAKIALPEMFVTLKGFTLHGKESAGEQPLFHARQIDVQLHVTLWFHKQADVRSIKLTAPAIRIVSDAQGNTNLPEPKLNQRPGKRDFIDTLLDVKAQQLEIEKGSLSINDERVPLDLKTNDLALTLRYDSQGPKYLGHVKASGIDVKALRLNPLSLDLDADTELERGKVRVSQATLRSGDTKAEVRGFVYDLLSPSADFDLALQFAMRDVAKLVKVPVEPVGTGTFQGKVALGLREKFHYAISGAVKASGLAYKQDRISAVNVSGEGQLQLDNDSLTLGKLRLNALGGSFDGKLTVAGYDTYVLDGAIKGVATNQIQLTDRPLPLAAVASGPVRIDGRLGDAKGRRFSFDSGTANLALAPLQTGRPLKGNLNLAYRNGTIEAASSYLSTPDSEVTFNGALNSSIRIGARTANLEDIQPFLSSALPLSLRQGSISFDGTVNGSIEDPRIVGRLQANNVVYEKHLMERITAEFAANRGQIRSRAFSVQEQALMLTGSGTLGLREWKADTTSPVEATVDLKGAKIERLLAQLSPETAALPVTGNVSVTATVRGKLGAPEGEARLAAANVTAYGEAAEKVNGTVKFTPDVLEVTAGEAAIGKAQVPFSLRYARSSPDWKSGTLRWKVQSAGLDIAALHAFRERTKDISGVAAFNTDGEGQFAGADFRLRYLNGDLRIPSLSYKQNRVGSVELRAASKGTVLGVTGRSVFQGARLRLNGEWALQGKVPGEGSLSIAGGSFENLIAMFSSSGQTMPFQSAVEGESKFKVALLDPEATFEADLLLRRIQLNPDPTQILRGGAREQDLVVTNLRPVRVHLTSKEAVIQSAQFTATNTRVDITGKAAFGATAAWDLKMIGALNMAELQMLNKDLLGTGLARMDATVRGALDNPQVNGTLQLEKASLYFGDLPTGIDNVSGLVLFDRNRATVQALNGESGGGKFSLTGFVGFGGPALVYRLQAVATGVRVRYPEGASTTVNANLSLTGTSEDSLLAGNLALVRAGFNPRTDFASMLAQTAGSDSPITAEAASNEYLRGMQFDLRIESAPNLEFQTTLTRGLRADVDLRLRGNLVRPSLMGTVAFSEGEISLFGNKYTLNRGDIRFFNPTRIEPTFDLEAETRARGITVNVSFSGTPRKVNAAYRSDPPLQPGEIIALLAIGRDPNIGAGLATTQSNNTQSSLQGVGSLVGEAVASSLNGRLQKFFGVSRIKIDPQLTGVENIPQARLTLEQQVSKDITLTYITNLARTQEQIVRIQWDISRQWSATAIREENGLFGVDFQFRKRFK